MQMVACVAVLIAFAYRHMVRWRTWQLLAWLLLIAPVVAFASLRLPDAIVGVAMLTVVLSMREWFRVKRRTWLVLGIVAVAVAVNMRSEVLTVVLGSCAVSVAVLAVRRTELSAGIARYLAILSAAALAALVPWMVNAYTLTGTPLPMSTNGPGVVLRRSRGAAAQPMGSPWRR